MATNKKNKVQLYLVDNDPLIRKILIKKFEQNFNYNIMSFGYGEEFLQHLISSPIKKKKLKIIVLDYNFTSPDSNKKDSIEIIKYIKDIIPKAHIILLTPHITSHLENHARIFNLDACIKKNENSFLRLENVVNSIVSEHNIKCQRIKTQILFISFLSLLSMVSLFLFLTF